MGSRDLPLPSVQAWLMLLLLTQPTFAQKPLADVSTLRRPNLGAGADTNSWLAYYNYGVGRLRTSPKDADAAFAWAARIDPTRAEPLMGRWVAYWYRYPRLYVRSLQGLISSRDSVVIEQVDSLRLRALFRNPLVRREVEGVLYERLVGGAWSWDRLGRAFLAYTSGRYQQAERLFSEVVREDSAQYWARYDVALCLTAMRRYDSAAFQISALIDEIRHRAARRTNPVYRSQEVLLYGLGALRLLIGDTATARADLGQALTETLAFYPAHAELGDIDLAQGDTSTALAEYAQAMELAPQDGVLHYRYARVLGDVGQLPAAERELRRAIEIEPFFAPPYLGLALVLDTRGARAEALSLYRRYLERTYRDDPRIELAQQRIALLTR